MTQPVQSEIIVNEALSTAVNLTADPLYVSDQTLVIQVEGIEQAFNVLDYGDNLVGIYPYATWGYAESIPFRQALVDYRVMHALINISTGQLSLVVVKAGEPTPAPELVAI